MPAFRRLRFPRSGLILLALLAGATAWAEILYEGDSAYNHIAVSQEGDLRCLLFGRFKDNRETCIDTKTPDRPVFEYTELMFVGFLFEPQTRSVALLGLGGGFMPILFQKHLPDVRLQVVEIDPMVARLAKEYFGFTEGGNVKLEVADGRQYLKRNETKYDQIWLDAFNSDYIPAHLTTKEFFELVKKRLTERGVVVANVHHTNQLFHAQVTTMRASFRHVFVFPGHGSGNTILVASDHPRFTPEGFAQALTERGSARIGPIDLMNEAGKYNPSPVIRESPVLTDDYAPVNLLKQRE